MSKLELYLGLDVGSVSINLVLLNKDYRVLEKLYLRTQGKPIEVLKEGLEKLYESMPAGSNVSEQGLQAAAVSWLPPW